MNRQLSKLVISFSLRALQTSLRFDVVDLPSAHTDRQISSLSTKIFTQNLGLKLPHDVNNFIFSKFTESYFQQHLFAAKREPINHPFLIKIKEKDYKQALILFKLVSLLTC